MNKFLRREEGITLLELLVVMIIISILLALLGRSFLPQIFRAENTVAQDRAKIVYEGITTCASENDGLAGDFDYINGKYCFAAKKVENKVFARNVFAPPPGQATGGTVADTGDCWDNRLEERDDPGNVAAVGELAITPETDDKAAFVCTWGSSTGTAGAGASTQQDNDDARYFRVSVTDNRKTYFFVRSENGFFRCSTILASDDGTPETGEPMRCR